VKWPPALNLISCNSGSWKGAAVQRGLQPDNRGLAIVRSRDQATAGENIADCEGVSVIL
jgi:hypothetical protein